MSQQACFNFTPSAAPPADGEVERLVSYLYQRGPVWTPAKQILADLGINDRVIRKLKGLSNNRIISGPGCPGYRHLDHTTLIQINEVLNRCFSQARAMTADYLALRKLAHSLIR